MGLFDGLEHWIEKRKAKAAGEQFAKEGGGMFDLLKRNKTTIGAAFVGASGWAASSCQPVLGIDVLASVHLSCGTVSTGLLILGAFLTGAGVLNSDHHEAVVQGIVPPVGPPKDAPAK